MVAAAKPATSKQTKLLQRLRMPTLTDRFQCSLLITYLLEGEDGKGHKQAVGKRIRELRDTWLGAEVKVRKTQLIGRVIGLRMRSKREMEVIKESTSCTPKPFELRVKVGDHQHCYPPSDLKILTIGRQKQLF